MVVQVCFPVHLYGKKHKHLFSKTEDALRLNLCIYYWEHLHVCSGYVTQVSESWPVGLLFFFLSNSVLRETEKKWVFDYRYINFLQLYICSFKAFLIITHTICFYASNFEEVVGAYWFGLVCLSVRPSIHLSVMPFVGCITREWLMLGTWNFIYSMSTKNKRTRIFFFSVIPSMAELCTFSTLPF